MSQENLCKDVFAQLNTIEELQNKLAFQQQCQRDGCSSTLQAIFKACV